MAKFKNYVSERFGDIATDTGQNLGSYKIYLNKPIALIECDWKRSYCDWWWSINDYSYYNEKRVDYDEIWIKYDPCNGVSDPSAVSLRNAPETNPITVNPVIPCSTTLGSLQTPINTNGYVHHTTCKFFNKAQDYAHIIGIPVDEESWAVTMYLDYVDNLFNSRHPNFTITKDGKNVLITMSSNYSSANFPDGSGLPRLLNTNKDELDDSTDDVISYQKSSLTYTLPWNENIRRDYRLETQIPSYTNLGSGDTPHLELNKIDMFNDLLHFTTKTATKLKVSDLKIEGQKLSWISNTTRESYNIYVDGLLKETVTGTSWTIPDDLYYDQKHTYSISVNDWVKTNYFYKVGEGQRTPNASKKTFPVLRETYFIIYRGQDAITSTSWTNVGSIEAPTVTMTVPKLNSRTFVVSHSIELGEPKLYYKNGENGTLNPITNNTVTLDKMKVNTLYDLYFYASSTIDGKEFFSEPTNYPVTPTPYPKPSITGLTKTAINAYSVSFSSTVKPNEYEVYLNKVIYKGNATSPINVSGWLANSTNYIKVKCIYEEDQTYNSEVEVSYGANYTPLLKTPTLSKKDIKENNYEQGFGDNGSKEIIDNVITQVELSWQGIEYASGYVLYDKYKVWNNDTQSWEEGERIYPTQEPDKDTEFMQTTVYKIYMDNVMGYHDYSIRAIAATDESYNSNISNSIHLEQNFPLNPPVIEWTNPNTYIEIDEGVPNADFYSIQLVPSRGTTHTLFRSFDPEKYPFQYSFYDMVKDLRETESFVGSVFSRSYNAFYFHPSADSNVKIPFDVIKLNTPVNLLYEDTTGVLTWTGDSRAHSYDVSIRSIDGQWVTYNVNEPRINFTEKNGSPLASNLYIVYVTAKRDPESRTLPVYLDSEKSANFTFGLINTPKNFSRNVNQFSWDSVGADRYVFYEYVEATDKNGLVADSLLVLKYDTNGNSYYTFKVADEGEIPTHKAVSITTVDGGGTSLYLGMDKESLYRPTEGKHYYAVQAATSIENTDFADDTLGQITDGVIYSLLTDPIEVDIVYLKDLIARYTVEGESHIDWSPEDGIFDQNIVYDTRVNNINEKDMDSNPSYTMDKDEAGNYYFKVRSISTIDQFLYQTSEFSNEIIYNVFKLNRPVLTFTRDLEANQYSFNWEKVNNATQYYIRINKDGEDVYEGTQSENYYSYFPDVGLYAITVIAKNNELFKQPKYIDSETSNMIKFGVLAPPEISIEENIISWKENPLVDYYEIYNYGKKFSETDRNMFELDVSKPYSYSISVVAVSNEPTVSPSRNSNSVQYVVTQLQTPQNVRINDDDFLTWDVVLDADAYRIYIDNELTAITSNIRFDLNSIFSTRAGILKIYVIAFSNRINLIDSEPSNFILKRIEKEKKFNIVINEVNYDKIQLPFTMNFTLDESLDTAAITLAYIDVKKPFERLTPADIIIYESAGASRKFPMVIESDIVEEIKIENDIKYKHTLQLVEKTIILQNEIVPDFAISSSVRDFIVRDYATVAADTGPNSPFLKGDLVGIGTYDEIPLEELGELIMGGAITNLLQDLNIIPEFDLNGIPDDFEWKIPTGVAWFKGITPKGGIQNILPKNLSTGETFVLPNPITRLNCVCLSAKQIINWILNVLGFDDWIDVGGTVGAGAAITAISWKKIFDALVKLIPKGLKVIGWIVAIIYFLIEYIIYIIKILVGVRGYTWAGLLEKLMTTDLSIVGDCFYTDDDWAYPRRIYKIRPHHDGYEATDDEEIIKDIPTGLGNKVDLFSFPKSGEYDLILEVPAVDLDKLYDDRMIDFDSSIIKGGWYATLPTLDYMKDQNGNPTMYRAVWHGINVRKDNSTAHYKKISDILEKIMALTNNKYTIDPKILEYTSTFNCPDMTFSNGNYLYDVLETIGREFYGLPRLIEDNIITFDILDTSTFSTKQTSFWRDTDVLGTEKQDLENVASGFISNVSNMVPDEDYTIYPANGFWVSPRSDTSDTAATYIESMAIAVDKPIYKINKLFVKNAVKQMPDLILDISKYVYQDTVYGSLNNNRNGKGLALVWSQGKKFIRGLGQLPEAKKFYQIVGWGPDEYVIDNIIKDYIAKNLKTTEATANLSPNSPGDMLFQVEYQGYADPMLYIENPDKKDFKHAMYSVFNQEDNTISDTRFGNGAMTVLKRHNTNSIQKSYQAYSLIRLPLLGESITISGEPYYIDDLTYEFHNGLSNAVCNFSKNYNKINPRTTINSEYRQYELRADNIVDRSLNFNEYCMVGNEDTLTPQISTANKWMNILKGSLTGNNVAKPDCFYINCYNSENLDKIPYVGSDIAGNVVNKTIEGIALPLSYNRIGMSVSFSASMEDNFTAGFTLKRENTKESNLERVQGYVRYVGDDSMDQTPYMRLTLGSLSNYIKNYSYKENGVTVSVSDTFPEVPWLDQPTISLNDVFFSKYFQVYKDQREKLKFNYQMHFISNREGLFLHKGLTKYLFRSPTVGKHGMKPILVGYNNDITNKDILTEATRDTGCKVEILNNKILFKNFEATNNYSGLALIWPDTREIILEIRKPVSKEETVSIDPVYFNFFDKIKR